MKTTRLSDMTIAVIQTLEIGYELKSTNIFQGVKKVWFSIIRSLSNYEITFRSLTRRLSQSVTSLECKASLVMLLLKNQG